ncbi:MAG: PQQ-binding-like beta-propeller repeat protein, partial [Candidatus Hydrogenedentota bacterium]
MHRKSTTSIILIACILSATLSFTQQSNADDWPQWRGPTRDGVWHETGIVQSFSGPQIEHKWRAEVSNGYSSPTVAEGRVYIMDRVLEPDKLERVLCFDADTGKALWVHQYPSKYSVAYPDGPRAAVTINDGRAYSLGTMGHLRCLDAETGDVIWEKNPGTDYTIQKPSYGVATSPIVEGDLLIIQIGENPDGCIVAWDKATGEERWRALEDSVSYSSPVVVGPAGQRILICWTGNNIVGLDPSTGEVFWKVETPSSRGIINIADPVVDGDRLYLSSFYDGSFMFRLIHDS